MRGDERGVELQEAAPAEEALHDEAERPQEDHVEGEVEPAEVAERAGEPLQRVDRPEVQDPVVDENGVAGRGKGFAGEAESTGREDAVRTPRRAVSLLVVAFLSGASLGREATASDAAAWDANRDKLEWDAAMRRFRIRD